MTTDQRIETPQHRDGKTGPPALLIDWQLYESYLDDGTLSEADKHAFIETLWSIIVSFVDLGFHVNPVQEICGQVQPIATDTAADAAPMLDWEATTPGRSFADAANSSTTTSSERRRDGD